MVNNSDMGKFKTAFLSLFVAKRAAISQKDLDRIDVFIASWAAKGWELFHVHLMGSGFFAYLSLAHKSIARRPARDARI